MSQITMTPADAMITLENVNKWYGQFHVLKDINLKVKQGERIVLCGPSGSGKSTTIRCINHLEEHQQGRIVVDGIELNEDIRNIERVRQEVGMVFQQPNPFPMSIYDNVAYGPRIHGIKNKAQLDEIVERSLKGAALWDEVSDRLKKSALGLSGGQQQRLCIARALAVEPEVLLMDEPTSALDPISTLKIEDLMDDLKSKYTVAIVTHNMQQATRIADYTAFFLVGEVVEYATTDELFTMPKDKRTEDYITGRFG